MGKLKCINSIGIVAPVVADIQSHAVLSTIETTAFSGTRDFDISHTFAATVYFNIYLKINDI